MNHTVRLINDNILDGINSLIQANLWVDCIITRFNMDYFYEDTVEETLGNVADCLNAVLTSDGTAYIETPLEFIPLVSKVFTAHKFKLQNILTIPESKKKCCHAKRYVDNCKYVLFFSHECYPVRYMNPLSCEEESCSCQYSANWDWFSGTNIDAYRMMMRISTEHSQIILDPFMNDGAVGEAAILQDRVFIGIEPGRAIFDDTKEYLENLGE